jgi:hypothetical protein
MMKIVIDMLFQASAHQREQVNSMQLSVVVMIMLDQILSESAERATPVEEFSGRATLPAEPSRPGQPDPVPVPVRDTHGLYFLSDVLLDSAPPRSPQLPPASCLPVQDLLLYFRMITTAELQAEFEFRAAFVGYIHRRIDAHLPHEPGVPGEELRKDSGSEDANHYQNKNNLDDAAYYDHEADYDDQEDYDDEAQVRELLCL